MKELTSAARGYLETYKHKRLGFLPREEPVDMTLMLARVCADISTAEDVERIANALEGILAILPSLSPDSAGGVDDVNKNVESLEH